MRVLYVINSLGRGGAELNLLRLAACVQKHGVACEVLPLRRGSVDVAAAARARAVPVRRGGVADLLGVRLGSVRPDVVEGWMYWGAVAASVAGAGSACRVVWNLRHVPVAAVPESRSTRLALALLARLPSPARIVVNSAAGVEAHRALGIRGHYDVVENGVDTGWFVPDRGGADALRARLGIPRDAFVVLHLARFHPHKGHAQLLEAFAELPADRDYHLLMVGDGLAPVVAIASRLGVDRRRLHVLPATQDPRPAYAAADVLVSPSVTESFPTVVAEAMSCAKFCIVTDVGASAHLVDDCGRVVAPASPPALRDAIVDAGRASPEALEEAGRRARARVVASFSEDRMVRDYLDVLAGIRGQPA